MVLQNKYKARASRRYNSARGGTSDGRGRGGSRGRGGRQYTQEAFPSLKGEAEEDAEGSGSGGDDDDDDDDSTSRVENKFARRTIQSNAWRYAEPAVDSREEEVEEEAEVDLSGLLERVVRLDSSRTSKALSSQQAAEASLKNDVDDIDHTLLHILEKQRERERGKAITREDINEEVKSNRLTPSELKLLEMEGRRLLEEKDRESKHYGKAQGLKSQQPKTISINIGENQRKKEDSKTSNGRRVIRRQMNMAALYDEEEDPIAVMPSNGAILSLPPTNDKVQDFASNPALTRPVQASAPLREQEDFLDSII